MIRGRRWKSILRTFDFFGRSGKFDVALPFSDANFLRMPPEKLLASRNLDRHRQAKREELLSRELDLVSSG